MKKIFHVSTAAIVLTLIFSSIIFSQTATAPSAGDGTNGNPYQISTLENLYWIASSSARWDKHYVQTSDIDAASTNTWDVGDHDGDTGTLNAPRGWTAIGTSSTKFTGKYNGNGFTISNLYCSRPADLLGLFGYVVNAELENIKLTNIEIRGTKYEYDEMMDEYSGSMYVAGLSGRIEGTSVTNCHSDGDIFGFYCTGGLIGWAFNGSTITESSASGTVTSQENGKITGGVIGHMANDNISKSYSSATVSGKDRSGGLVASGYKITITDCYALGGVTGTNNVGGLVGILESNFGNATITNSYSCGSVSGSSFAGGLVGRNYENNGTSIINNCFWDKQTSSQSTSPVGTGKTTVQMKTQADFTGWDFSTVWQIVDGDGANYPDLRSNSNSSLPVELISFTASIIDGVVNIQWQTATEINNYGFEVEKQNAEFSSQNSEWRKLGFVEGNGNSNSLKQYSYQDIEQLSGTVKYRLKQIDNDGSYKYSIIIEVAVGHPIEFNLEQNYPNPFNPSTTIKFSIPVADAFNASTTLKIYDILGNEIATLIDENKPAGNYEVNFDATNLSSGLYLYTLTTGNFKSTKKMMLLK